MCLILAVKIKSFYRDDSNENVSIKNPLSPLPFKRLQSHFLSVISSLDKTTLGTM